MPRAPFMESMNPFHALSLTVALACTCSMVWTKPNMLVFTPAAFFRSFSFSFAMRSIIFLLHVHSPVLVSQSPRSLHGRPNASEGHSIGMASSSSFEFNVEDFDGYVSCTSTLVPALEAAPDRKRINSLECSKAWPNFAYLWCKRCGTCKNELGFVVFIFFGW